MAQQPLPALTTRDDLRPGDILLYGPKGWLSWGTLICIKTWSTVSHCEIWIGEGRAIGSRAEGVNTYAFMPDCLQYVLRPPDTLDLTAALGWYLTVRGAKYDWWGLMTFANVGEGFRDKWICSELVTEFMRHGGVEFFRPSHPAQKVCPGMFTQTPVGTLHAWAGQPS